MRTDDDVAEEVKQWEQSEIDRFAGRMRPSGPTNIHISWSGFERNHLFVSQEGKQFKDLSGISGLNSPSDGRAFVIWDYDRDGWQDMAVVNANNPFFNFYRNRIGSRSSGEASAHMFAVRLVGGNHTSRSSKEFSARDGYGSVVQVFLKDRTLTRELRCGEGFDAQNSSVLFFGLGKSDRVEKIEVAWPSGKKTTVKDLEAGLLLTIFENPEDVKAEEGYLSEPYIRSAPEKATPLPVDSLSYRYQVGAKMSDPSPPLSVFVTMATWCVACKKEMPQVQLLRDSFGADSVALFGLPIDEEDDRERLRLYKKSVGPAYNLLVDLEKGKILEAQKLIHDTLRTDATPVTFITDSKGRVIFIDGGVPSVSTIRKLLKTVGFSEEK